MVSVRLYTRLLAGVAASVRHGSHPALPTLKDRSA